jgi:hypothetical protein
MESPRRIQADTKPEAFEMLGDGTYYYNYDVQEIQAQDTDPETQEQVTKTKYSFIQVMLRGIPEYKALVQAVIREFVSQDQEFDLINSYNKAVAAGESEGDDITNYKEYLVLIDSIKTGVKNDLNIV